MKRKPRPDEQLPLILPANDPVTWPCSAEPSLVAALADLLIQVIAGEARTKGGRDERQDP